MGFPEKQSTKQKDRIHNQVAKKSLTDLGLEGIKEGLANPVKH